VAVACSFLIQSSKRGESYRSRNFIFIFHPNKYKKLFLILAWTILPLLTSSLTRIQQQASSRESMSSSLILSPATPEDAPRIAAIHLAAFDVNPLLHAQFPTLQDLANLEEFLAEDTLEELADSTKKVLVVKTEEGKIISFAKWTLPEAGDEVLHEDTAWPKGCVRELLDEYYMKAEAVKCRLIGGERCYRKFGFTSLSSRLNALFSHKIPSFSRHSYS
jgi:hypothetical protein